MRARGAEFEHPTVELHKYQLLDLSSSKLREVADLLDKDPVYQRMHRTLYDPEYGGGSFGGPRFHYLREVLINRVLQLLVAPD